MLIRRSSLSLLLVTVALIETVFFSSCAHAQRVRNIEEIQKPPELEAELILYKNEYLLREPIWIKVQATNVGKETGKFHFVTFDGLVIKDSKGTRYEANITWEYSPISIKPNETRERELEVSLAGYGLPEDSFHVRWYLPPERYSVFYRLREDVESEVCSFVISTPTGDELKAMNSLKESYDLFIQRKWEESTSKMRGIFQKYPKSKYAPFALLRTADSSQELYKLIEDYPNSRESVRAVSGIADIFKRGKDKVGFIGAMNGLTKRFSNTDIAKEAEQQLKQVKDKDFE